MSLNMKFCLGSWVYNLRMGNNLLELLKKIKTYGLRRSFSYIIPESKRFLRYLLYGSYSHPGEDLFLAKQFPRDYIGFYIDVGSNDPKRKNNTYYFYKKGWSGITIEPDSLCFSKNLIYRPNDINLNIGVSDSSGNLDFYSFFPSLLNTFSKEDADVYVSQGYKLEKILKIKVKKLYEVIKENVPQNLKIDILSIDTEGYDLKVLKGTNLQKIKPSFICVELLKDSISGEIDIFLRENKYKLIYNNSSNSIYKYEG